MLCSDKPSEVNVTVSTATKDGKDRKSTTYKVQLVKESNQWKISSMDRKS